jgi:hypothetical protein
MRGLLEKLIELRELCEDSEMEGLGQVLELFEGCEEDEEEEEEDKEEEQEEESGSMPPPPTKRLKVF